MFYPRALPLRFACLGFLCVSCAKEPATASNGDETLLVASADGTLSAASNLSAIAVSTSQIALTWQDNTTNETGFEIHRSTTGPPGTFTLVATPAANVTSFSDHALIAERLYCYKVRAFTRSGRKTSYTSFSATSCAMTPAAPPPTPPLQAPSNARAKPSSASAITIAWDNITDESGFRVERSFSTGGPWSVVATTAANVLSAIDAGRSSDQQVCYRVIAFGASSASAPSNADCTAPPARPTSLTATTVSEGIDLTWADNSGVEDGYRVERSIDGVNFYLRPYLPANTTSYHDPETNSATTYWYRISASKDGGTSDPSTVASAQGSCTQTSYTDVCDNGLDDDCDGAADLADGDCTWLAWDCGFDHCPPSYVCGYDGNCISHCYDGQINGDEGGIDCGGSCSAKCQLGQECGLHYDCASGFCSYGVCRNPGGTP